MQVPLYTATGESKSKIELPNTIFAQEVSKRVLHEVLVGYQANQRRGTSDTKTRAEVSGGGHKPWRQKGTGNARSGSNRSPLWRKGGIIFGPHPRSYHVELSADKKRLAFATALSIKAQREEVGVLEKLGDSQGKTRALGKVFDKAIPEGKILVVVDKKTDILRRAIGNICRITLQDANELNADGLMRARRVLITKDALKALENRFPKG
jgi:large subunit ribosomal protein L4